MSLQLKEFTTCAANQGSETLEVVNTGTSAVNLNQISIKFWVDDTTGQSLVGVVNYGGNFGPTNQAVNGVAINTFNFSPACGPDGSHQANWEVTVSDTDTRTLAAGTTWTGIQAQVHMANYGNFSNDSIWYSPCGIGGGSTYTNDLHYAVYYQGNLVTASGGAPPSCRPLPTCTPHTGGSVAAQVVEAPSRKTEWSALAVPNISQFGEPVKFMVNLQGPARIQLEVYSLAGELVYQASSVGSAGENAIPWQLENSAGSQLASGLYIYRVVIDDGTTTQAQIGKIAVIR